MIQLVIKIKLAKFFFNYIKYLFSLYRYLFYLFLFFKMEILNPIIIIIFFLKNLRKLNTIK